MVDRLKEEAQKLKQKGGQKTDGFLKLPKTDDAEVKIRILPAKNFYSSSEPNLFYKQFGSHWYNGQNIKCPKLTFNKPCPICEAAKELRDSGDEESIEAAKEFAAKKRVWVNVVEVAADGTLGNPKVFEFGPKLRDNILSWCVDDDYDDLSDPEKGYTFRVIKTKKDGFPNYDQSKPVKNSSSIKGEIVDLLERSMDIHEFIDKSVKSYDEINAIFQLGGGTASTTTEEDTEEINHDELLAKINSRLKSDEDE